ncbi:DUF1501 domain-containing protein [Verrucomicrobiales bacterium BCK34]|nr:DUF1501 domain-containing protein [Verrucomicrobiales bacterium BCK34]
MTNIAELAGKDPLSRRYFMEMSAKLTLGVSTTVPFLPRNFQAQDGAKAKNLIYIYMAGGMTHLDTFDPKKNSGVMGSTEMIDTNVDNIKFGMHLEKLSKHADKLAVINSMTSTNGAHEQGMYIMRTGYNKRATIVHPTIGPWAETLLGKRGEILPDSVVVGRSTSNAGFMDPSLSPLPIADPSAGVPNTQLIVEGDRFDRRMEMAQKLGQQFTSKFKYMGPDSYVEYYNQANKLLKSDALSAFDISNESNASDYGTGRLGQGCLLARKLVENGVRVVEVIAGGWDMHVDVDGSTATRVPELDVALSTLLTDLESRGLLESTMVAVGTEFGRTPDINMNSGRDHYPAAYSCVLAGGGIKGGTKYGETDGSGKKVKSDHMKPEDFLATIGHGMGLNLEETIYSPTQRPFTFADKGKPATKLFG